MSNRTGGWMRAGRSVRVGCAVAFAVVFGSRFVLGGGVAVDRPPEQDGDTLLLIRFDEPDEKISVGADLAIEPIFVNMEAVHREGRFGGALRFVGRPGLRQSMVVPLPERLRHTRHGSRKDPSRFVELEVPLVLIDNTRGFTIELWVYPQAMQEQTVLAGVNSGASVVQAPWSVGLSETGKLRFTCGSGLHRFQMESRKRVAAGAWTHVAVVGRPEASPATPSRPGGIQLYLNGHPASESVAMRNAALQRISQPGSDGTAICLGGPGRDATGGHFDGLIDELRLSTVGRDFEPDPAALIGRRKELFLDDVLVARMDGLKRVLNQPERYRGNPLLQPRGEWEARAIQPLGTVYDPRLGLVRTWYRAFNLPDTEASTCYAFSRDGLHWVQPTLGLAAYGGSVENNIVAPRRSAFFFLDSLARPGEGNICATAKLQYGSGDFPGGPFKQVLMRSPDGVTWPWGKVEGTSGYQGWPYSRIVRQEAIMAVDRPLISDPKYFEKLDKLVIIDKEGEADAMKVRQWARVGWDLTHWQDPYLTDLRMSEKNDQAWYGIKTRDEGSVMVGITDAYHGTKGDRWLDFQLVVSRDGYDWRHVAEQGTFFPVGDKGTWDGGMVFYAQPVELPGSDKLLIYYTGSWIRHDTVDDAKPEQLPVYNLGLALLRKEGYASIENDGRTAVGVLETKPIRFRGRRLFVNADASRGSVRVELCDASGKPLPGFHAGGAKPLTADNLGHVVEWGGTMDVSALAGKAIVVKFYLQKGAKLYSYRFDDPDPHRTEVAGVRR